MREIKFRAWDKTQKRFGYYEIINGVVGWLSNFDSLDKNREQDNQYTGLKDKNGKEIYEGDLLKGPMRNLNSDYFHIKWENFTGEYGDGCGYDMTPSYAKEFEIIGNIYENPELLDNKI